MTMVEILRQKLKQIFAKTAAAMPPVAWEQSLDDFLKETEASPTDVVEDLAYQFPAYLRLKKMTSGTAQAATTAKAAGIVQTAYFEWILYSRAHLDFGHAKHERGFLTTEPSLEIFSLSEAAKNLQMQAGVYAIFKANNNVEVIGLRSEHVQMLEILLEGDRKFRAPQLVEWMAGKTSISSALSSARWQMTLEELIRWGVIQDNS